MQHGYCVGISREAPQPTASEGLIQGPYVTARERFDPTTLRMKSYESTNEPPRIVLSCLYTARLSTARRNISWERETSILDFRGNILYNPLIIGTLD